MALRAQAYRRPERSDSFEDDINRNKFFGLTGTYYDKDLTDIVYRYDTLYRRDHGGAVRGARSIRLERSGPGDPFHRGRPTVRLTFRGYRSSTRS